MCLSLPCHLASVPRYASLGLGIQDTARSGRPDRRILTKCPTSQESAPSALDAQGSIFSAKPARGSGWLRSPCGSCTASLSNGAGGSTNRDQVSLSEQVHRSLTSSLFPRPAGVSRGSRFEAVVARQRQCRNSAHCSTIVLSGSAADQRRSSQRSGPGGGFGRSGRGGRSAQPSVAVSAQVVQSPRCRVGPRSSAIVRTLNLRRSVRAAVLSRQRL